MEFEHLTQTIIGAAMEVHRTLGPGFLECIYKNALLRELELLGVSTKTEVDVPIRYKGVIVGRHRLDIVIEDFLIIELKAISAIGPVQLAQILSYLKATHTPLGLVLNFGEASLRWKRVVKTLDLTPRNP